ncbi:MAG TPA: orotate phosphoribosyltransferase [Verrucomicrobiales bacterium]|nr:orotate phosphoribosyltransferase [Verrucomicrobiales bacterium]|tara:strand:- start:234 stop:797 length:564 start_codon:yes stop_codon:yes gene_type:complete
MTRKQVLEVFRQNHALLEGHFILRSGLRSREFFQCAQALQKMPVVEQLGEALADKVRNHSITTVVAPAMGGLVIGQEVARQLGVRFIFVEKENDALVLRRGFQIDSREKILIVEDVVTRGGRADETIQIVREHGGDLQALAVLVDRSSGGYDPGVPFISLLEMQVETFAPDDLPEDLQSLEPVKPGS